MLIQGNSVSLRALDIDDCADFYTWSQDREVTQYSISSYAYPQSKSDISQWLTTINHSTKTVSMGICCIVTGKLIGYAGITAISTLNRSGEYFILIGDKEYWGKGIGSDVTSLIVDYGFNVLGLHRIELTAYATNPAAIKAYEKAGFQHEGVMRQAGYRHGKFIDKVLMSVLSSEYSTP